MPLYGGIDLHANNKVVVLLDEQDQMVYATPCCGPLRRGCAAGVGPLKCHLFCLSVAAQIFSLAPAAVRPYHKP